MSQFPVQFNLSHKHSILETYGAIRVLCLEGRENPTFLVTSARDAQHQ